MKPCCHSEPSVLIKAPASLLVNAGYGYVDGRCSGCEWALFIEPGIVHRCPRITTINLRSTPMSHSNISWVMCLDRCATGKRTSLEILLTWRQYCDHHSPLCKHGSYSSVPCCIQQLCRGSPDNNPSDRNYCPLALCHPFVGE